jgi:hypothetical protein
MPTAPWGGSSATGNRGRWPCRVPRCPLSLPLSLPLPLPLSLSLSLSLNRSAQRLQVAGEMPQLLGLVGDAMAADSVALGPDLGG